MNEKWSVWVWRKDDWTVHHTYANELAAVEAMASLMYVGLIAFIAPAEGE